MPSRADVVATAQAMHRAGLVVATTGNVSARDGDTILITAAGVPYETMTPDDVVPIESERRSSEWRLHAAVYGARRDVDAIVHTHSVHATAWSFLGEELDTGTEELAHFAGGAVRTSRFAPTGTDEIAAAALEALEGRRAALLAHHGCVGVGATPAEALDACRVVEHQAAIAWLLRRT